MDSPHSSRLLINHGKDQTINVFAPAQTVNVGIVVECSKKCPQTAQLLAFFLHSFDINSFFS